MRPFHPIAGSTVNISVTTSSANVALPNPPSGEFQIRLYNAGPSTVFIARGTSSAVTASTTADVPLPSGAIEVVTVNNPDASKASHVAAIAASGTATLYISMGSGY